MSYCVSISPDGDNENEQQDSQRAQGQANGQKMNESNASKSSEFVSVVASNYSTRCLNDPIDPDDNADYLGENEAPEITTHYCILDELPLQPPCCHLLAASSQQSRIVVVSLLVALTLKYSTGGDCQGQVLALFQYKHVQG